MKILLISVNNEMKPYPVAPLGVAYIATILKNKGHSVYVLDLCFAEDDYLAIEESLKKFFPDLLGLSIRNIDNLTFRKSVYYLPRVKEIVRLIKCLTSAQIIVGGSGFSLFPEEVLRYLQLEMGIVGEGEISLPQYIDVIIHGGKINDIPNLCYIKDGKYTRNNTICSVEPFTPKRDLLNNNKYMKLGGMANIQSKRGCPFHCTYCTYPSLNGNTVRLREPLEIVDEIKELNSKYGVDYVFFVDDIFNCPEKHTVALCEEIIRHELKIDWACFATPKGMTKELALLMSDASCKGIEFGTDAGSRKTLKAIGKSFTIEDIAFATECCNSINLPNAHYIIVGGPDEDDSTLSETFSLFNKIEPTAVIVFVGIRIYPNTLLYYKAIEDKIIEKDQNILEPVFYISPKIDRDVLLQKIYDYAQQSHNWIVPGLDIRCDTDMLTVMRKIGKRGPLWDMI